MVVRGGHILTHLACPRDDKVAVTLSRTLLKFIEDSVTIGEVGAGGGSETEDGLRAIIMTLPSVVVKATSASVAGLMARPDTRQCLASLMCSLTLTHS